MAKRAAQKYLTHDNYDEEEEEEESGTFEQASNTSIATRDIKKAKRRLVGQDRSSPAGGAFQSFTGLAGDKSAKATFSFNAMANKPFASMTGGLPSSVTSAKDSESSATSNASTSSSAASSLLSGAPPASSFSFGFTGQPFVPVSAKKTEAQATSTETKATSSSTESTVGQKSTSFSDYHKELKALNESVLRWIEQHVKADPTCILSPIFTDYDRYVKELDKKYPVDPKPAGNNVSGTKASNKDDCTTSTAPSSTNNGLQTAGYFGSTSTSVTSTSSASSPAAPTGLFTFGTGSATSSGSGALKVAGGGSLFSSSISAASSPFTFGSSFPKPAAAAPAEQPAAAESAATGEDDDEYVPPKPEVVEVKEDDAFFTVKCKLFYKKDTLWQERGVGNLFLKSCAGGKTQMVVRADTNLGNILLNIMLNKSIPTARQGNNNVSLICVPNPPISEKNKDDKTPVCMLIRVKTAADADELLEQLNSHKN